jgi:hypothetical protein
MTRRRRRRPPLGTASELLDYTIARIEALDQRINAVVVRDFDRWPAASAILNWATVSEFRTGPNPARWRGHHCRRTVEAPDNRHRRLLRARHNRPSRRTAEKHDKLTSMHWSAPLTVWHSYKPIPLREIAHSIADMRRLHRHVGFVAKSESQRFIRLHDRRAALDRPELHDRSPSRPVN